MENLKTLTVKVAEQLIGKTIEWHAPAYHANEPYSGISIITEIDLSKRFPISCTNIKGDGLEYAFLDTFKEDDSIIFSYSEYDRFVTFKVIENVD
ncbi:hypothetical protein ETU09_04775 [Apibacter muscae]|uniref:Uncharacterized protein n=1 Tax=Apibacter muscae TaxID=2509004 RepID=A0A563DGG6_9FLAO|nr:hypothetical protein [Apibacter muscae]TWP29159.1 hypothetical protein ETU09_04775 [Apibacter muscae]